VRGAAQRTPDLLGDRESITGRQFARPPALTIVRAARNRIRRDCGGTLRRVIAHAGDSATGIGPEAHPATGADGGSAVLGAARPEIIDDWAELFQALSDTNRLRILLAVHHSPGICVADLAEAVGMTANATSHALAALRLRGVVRAERSGRERRWRIASNDIHNLLHQVGATHSPLHPDH
jgi:DNA-binding transcriptional ArsR family regulator